MKKYFELFSVREEFFKLQDDVRNLLIKSSLGLVFSICLGFGVIVLKQHGFFKPILFYFILGMLSIFVGVAVRNIILCFQELKKLDLSIHAVNKKIRKE